MFLQSNTTANTVLLVGSLIDGFYTPIKHPTSGGQARDQEAAVQQTFHLVRSSFFYLSALGLNATLTSLYYAHSCT